MAKLTVQKDSLEKDFPYKVKWNSSNGHVSGVGLVELGKEFSVPDQISYERAKELEGQKLLKRSGD